MEASALREQPVFVTTDGRRARQLRYASFAALALGCLWLGGLVLGTLGFGQLLPLPDVGHAADRPVGTPQRTNEPASSAPSASVLTRDAPHPRSSSAARSRTLHASAVRRTVSGGSTAQARRTQPSAPVAVPPQPAAPTLTLARQGWARRGLTEPAGQTRRATVQSEPTPSGQTRARGGGTHETTTTTPATPVTAPVPPGQQKKADDPGQTG